jgi:hypothetical protein
MKEEMHSEAFGNLAFILTYVRINLTFVCFKLSFVHNTTSLSSNV